MVFRLLKEGFKKVQAALSKTRSLLGQKLRTLFSGPIDESKVEELEQILFEADLGPKTASELAKKVRQELKKNREITSTELIDILKAELLKKIETPVRKEVEASPYIILIVGVNGNGKTTSCAKLAKKYQDSGKKVILGAADTYRAAAQEQISLWAERLQLPVVRGLPKSDPSSVVFDTLTSALAKKIDIAIIDTAGRLHTKTPLMQELDKIQRVSNKVVPGAPHETLLVLDATVGQNAIDQAKTFLKYAPVSGLILTKLDGTAKGGVVINIWQELKIPVKFIGVGERVDDLEPFEPEAFIKSIFD